jgi:hypothetical protein
MLSCMDDPLDRIAEAAAALHPADRDGFVHAAVARLRFEPAMGPSTANRIIQYHSTP